ncbi:MULTISPECIES: ribosome biogenesis GTP-binding protein YihA/YsxC [Marinococcus]|jgi:GTP-binding protein|uniref:Probable GTP-binding protein EngB n=1 Tax=Marinococcus luteus TaxID=1122204 RepID=A0A1H2VIU1_9BACI|nr:MULTISPECIES: ribosome biogenesis GTP-binding protein YihA/YsxC [Marinococcus]MDX6152074.1 ribosome biogenesis GTP-binding protein YihA/YsxC [Marinococcus sp. PL1-022]SDW68140.1 GTP-binding protein [Marinococcus luteus]
MKVHKSELVISAVSPKQYPEGGLPEIALAGRSNVGKSSFINSLLARKNLARTSSKPGKTRTLNFYNIEDRFLFVDVPGYGYAKVSKSERAAWGEMMEEYLKSRDVLKAAFMIIDFRHEPTKDDIAMYDYLKFHELPVVIIATKADKITKNKRPRHLKRVKETLKLKPEDQTVVFSAETAQGKDEAWRAIEQFI